MANAKLPRGALPAAQLAIVRAATDFGHGNVVAGDHETLARAALAETLPVIARSVLRDAAKHILLLGDLSAGLRCPDCHGKPATHHYVHATSASDYTCGCGHEWTGSRWAADDRARSIEQSLKLLAAGKPLPDLPAKENDDG